MVKKKTFLFSELTNIRTYSNLWTNITKLWVLFYYISIKLISWSLRYQVFCRHSKNNNKSKVCVSDYMNLLSLFMCLYACWCIYWHEFLLAYNYIFWCVFVIPDNVMLNGFGVVVNSLGKRIKPYLPQIAGFVKVIFISVWSLNWCSAIVDIISLNVIIIYIFITSFVFITF